MFAAIEQMAKSGAHSIRVETLAKSLGVSKGSFYWHFKNRQALLDEMLRVWEEEGTSAIISKVSGETSEPRDRLKKLIHRVFQSTPTQLAFESSLRAWASSDEEVKARVLRVEKRRVAYVSDLLVELTIEKKVAQTRSELFYSMLVGDMLRNTYSTPKFRRAQIDTAYRMLLRK